MKRKWIIFFAGGLLIAAAAATLYEGLRPWLSPTIKTANPSTADTDSFEVIVYKSDGNPIAQSLELQAARKFIKAHPTATFLLPQKQIDSIEMALQKAEQANGGAPQTTVSAIEVAPGRQVITLAFHYGNRTFSYRYEATGESIFPRSASRTDLGGEKRTVYR